MFVHGVRGTGLEDVFAVAKVGKGQFYHYFADKSDLVRAVIVRQTERVLKGQRPVLDALDSWDAIAAWFDLLVSIQERQHCIGGCPLGSLASELADLDEIARLDLVASFDQWEAYLMRGLAQMQVRGELQATADPGALAAATMAGIQGGLLLTQTRKDTRPLRLALAAMQTYLHTFATENSEIPR
jgi:AcrR family transcriptional regulator